jgi:hypothetical protein
LTVANALVASSGRGHQAAILVKRRPRNVAVFGQLSVKAICSTARQRTTFVP